VTASEGLDAYPHLDPDVYASKMDSQTGCSYTHSDSGNALF
jgi:hypothetical protein